MVLQCRGREEALLYPDDPERLGWLEILVMYRSRSGDRPAQTPADGGFLVEMGYAWVVQWW